MKNYLLKKRFNSSFCDLLPVLTANALRFNLDIFKEISTGETVKHSVSSNCHAEKRIWLHLKNDHYSTLDLNLGLPTTATESRLIINDHRMVYDSAFLRKVNSMAVHKIKRSVQKQLFRLKIWKPGSVSTHVTLHTVTSPPPGTVPVTPSIRVSHLVTVPIISTLRNTLFNASKEKDTLSHKKFGCNKQNLIYVPVSCSKKKRGNSVLITSYNVPASMHGL